MKNFKKEIATNLLLTFLSDLDNEGCYGENGVGLDELLSKYWEDERVVGDPIEWYHQDIDYEEYVKENISLALKAYKKHYFDWKVDNDIEYDRLAALMQICIAEECIKTFASDFNMFSRLSYRFENGDIKLAEYLYAKRLFIYMITNKIQLFYGDY